jgi:hypothetical protein
MKLPLIVHGLQERIGEWEVVKEIETWKLLSAEMFERAWVSLRRSVNEPVDIQEE